MFFIVTNGNTPPPRPSPPVLVPPVTNGDRWLPTESHFISESGNTLHVRFGGGLRSQRHPPEPSAPPAHEEVKEEPAASTAVGVAIGVRGN